MLKLRTFKHDTTKEANTTITPYQKYLEEKKLLSKFLCYILVKLRIGIESVIGTKYDKMWYKD